MYIGAFISEPMYYCRTREIFHTCFFLLCVVRAARGSAPPMTKGIVALEEAEKPSFPQKQHPTIIGFFHSFCDKPLTDSLSFSLPFTPLFSSVQILIALQTQPTSSPVWRRLLSNGLEKCACLCLLFFCTELKVNIPFWSSRN